MTAVPSFTLNVCRLNTVFWIIRTIGERKAPGAPYSAGQSQGQAWKIKLREQEIQSMGIKINK